MIISFITLFILNVLFIIFLDKIAKTIDIYDVPDNKLKLHKKKTPIIGGLILIINFSIIFIYQILFLKKFLILDINNTNTLEVFSLLFLIYSFFFLGLFDDKYNLTPLKKILFSISAILLASLFNNNLTITNFSLSFYDNRIFLENLSIIFTIFCVLILINSLNFYDGINGQSCLIFFAFFVYLLLKSDLAVFYLLCLILIIIIMFLNLRNLIFLGDSGIFLLGIILSISLIYEYNVQKNIIYADEIFFLLLLPGLDLVRLTLTRILRSKNPLTGDREHVHHLLINKYSLVASNILLFFLSIFPIVLFTFIKLNFFLTFSLFVIIYILLIKFLKSNGKK